MSVFVLDNSVAMRWCFDSGKQAYADALLDQLEAEQSIAYVPLLWRYEVSAAYLELAVRRKLPLATLDEKMIIACHAAGVTVLHDDR